MAALNGSNASGGADNIITIKQESMANVDSLVGSYVDSTTFLPSPNSQIINANLVQSIAMANEANGVNDGKYRTEEKFFFSGNSFGWLQVISNELKFSIYFHKILSFKTSKLLWKLMPANCINK